MPFVTHERRRIFPSTDINLRVYLRRPTHMPACCAAFHLFFISARFSRQIFFFQNLSPKSAQSPSPFVHTLLITQNSAQPPPKRHSALSVFQPIPLLSTHPVDKRVETRDKAGNRFFSKRTVSRTLPKKNFDTQYWLLERNNNICVEIKARDFLSKKSLSLFQKNKIGGNMLFSTFPPAFFIF